MPVSKAQQEAFRRYQKKSQRRFQLAFHVENDKDVIEQLNKVPSKCDYVRKLIREDLKKGE